ncbi:tRNA a64-2'-o-ribosylphosphate transferase [Saccharata proteae CBS 121410]|uniref:tRNA a64-2'-o-ribosylphosphate transferase n=1 Tax=Saccharata proteae CBS 121410 TaxID=1314787 RepID=A0A9P4HXU1_9PEZI|nr:tRNA a64-2'-o-ribosylphosphate transferase [Saccharata proteae CBS 121410]
MAAQKLPIQTSDIIFPVLSTDFSTTLSSLKRSTLAISNRLRSIAADATFVCAVADAYNLPLVANERCGSWYIPLGRKKASAYFKSTDGHTGEWAFSLRRLNTQVLGLVGETNGCVVVDSTRRGKRMPDALSKTVPIWCAVWNRLLFPNDVPAGQLHTPPQSVSASEHSQMQDRIDGFVQQARQLGVDLDTLRKQISKPLRPLWITQDSALPAEPPEYSDFIPILLCTASRRVPGGEASEGGYVQGAGDDSEGWAHGLTAQLFWENQEELLRTEEADLPELIGRFVAQSSEVGQTEEAVLIKPTTSVYIAPLAQLAREHVADESVIVACSEQPDLELQRRWKSRYLHLKCGTGKLGSRDLRNEIQKIEPFLHNMDGKIGRILIGCQTGKDISVGVALAILCLYIDDSVLVPTC